MLRVGLTGGMAAGKSAVAARWADAGIAILDADRVGHELLAQDAHLQADIAAAFGAELLPSGGEFNRRELARRAFASSASQQRLNRILHPAIHAQLTKHMQRLAAEKPDGIAAIEAALLLEAGMGGEFDALVLVTAPREQQMMRAHARGFSRQDAEARLALQMSDADKQQWLESHPAPYFRIHNDAGLDRLAAQADASLGWLQHLANKSHEEFHA